MSGKIDNYKHIHIVGVCGVGTSAIAIGLHKKGFKITGSDKGFYPPVSTNLTTAGVTYYAGWHPDKMIASGTPDLIIAGGSGTASSNPELHYAKEHGIKVISFAEAIGLFFTKKRSVVCVGTWGKTTTSALLSYIMIQAGLNPSYFTGGVSLSHDPAQLTDSEWSVFEGDEYQAATWDRKAKFFYYNPTDLLITSLSWDHADLYPTESSYQQAFEELIKNVQHTKQTAQKIPQHDRQNNTQHHEKSSSNVIVACADEPAVITLLQKTGADYVRYGKNQDAEYRYQNITHTKQGISVECVHKNTAYTIKSPMLGSYNASNITGVFAMACELGIAPGVIIQAIASFKGIKRRLERRYEGVVTVLDCHAPTPDKARSVIESIREVYKGRLIVVFEPNIGGRQRETIGMYGGAFDQVNTLFLPRFTKLKVNEGENEARALEANELREIIHKNYQETGGTERENGLEVLHEEEDDVLIEKVAQITRAGDTIAFLGSHGFRGMIEGVIEKLKQQEKLA